MVRVLALDLATVSGLAVDRPGGGDAPLTEEFRVPVDGEAMGRAFHHLRQKVMDSIAVHAPDYIAFEAPITQQAHGLHAAFLLLGMAAIVEEAAHAANIEAFACDIQTVRKHFCGSGRAKKLDVMHRCRLLGWQVQGHNAADAAAVWDYARSVLRSNAVRQAARATA